MAPRINIPPLTRGLLVSLLVLSLLNAAARFRSWDVDRTGALNSRQYYAPYLTIVPGTSIMYPWVFVTATLAEQNVFGMLITGATLFYGGRYLERAWGSSEYLKFLALISILPNILTFISYVMAFAATKVTGLATTSISGGIAIQAAFLVSFKQLVPEHTVSLLRSLIRIRVKHFPAIFLVANTISGVLFGTDTAALLAWFGFFTSWTYLRFYRVSPSLAASSTGEGPLIKGDASDTFAFAFFWPDVIHAPVAKVSDIVYSVLVFLRLCTPFSAEDVDASNEQASARGEGGLPSLLNPSGGSSAGLGGNVGGSGGGSRREEAERRRAIALKALDQRLHAATVRPPPVAHTGPASLGETTYETDTPRRDGARTPQLEGEKS